MLHTKTGLMNSDRLTFLLYYHYVDIPDPCSLQAWNQQVCLQLSLKGRIRISSEGLNGTLSGEFDDIHRYIQEISLREDLQPHKIDWKISRCLETLPRHQQEFQNLSVKVTKEVVSLDFSQQERDAALKGLTFLEPYLPLLICSREWGAFDP
jgi:UPF0176 protein